MDGNPAKHTQTLSSPNFIGLLLAQFTATFNDQALHIVAIFFASDIFVRYLNLRGFDEKGIVALVTACFITPFLLFSPLAGEVADRFSKRSTIVFWKVVEVLIMALALVALSLPHWITNGAPSSHPIALTAAILAASTVFLMGVHSTFFVPAKYGIMPELLDPVVLSRGNGLLEGTSFMAQIFGTAAGGLLYAKVKSEIRPGVLVPGHEWLIGVLLLVLAVAGTATAVLMEKVPAANPGKRIDWNWWGPLRANLILVRQSKPLMLALTGIAFAAFMTLFVRQTLIYNAEQAKELAVISQLHAESSAGPASSNPAGAEAKQAPVSALDEPESQVALLLALIGFGVGLGSLCAGYLSGDRVELGLVPVGGVLLVSMFVLLAFLMRSPTLLAVLLFLIGVSAGFYIVPLYTLMQHRAPKALKGNVVAASNFINVTGGIASVVLFFVMTFVLERIFGPSTSLAAAASSQEAVARRQTELAAAGVIPQALFGFTALVVLATAVKLTLLQPDLDLRLMEFFRGLVGCRPSVSGLEHIPTDGPVLLLTDCDSANSARRLAAAVDRPIHVLLVPRTEQDRGWRFGLWLSRLRVQPRHELNDAQTRDRGDSLLSRGEMLAVSVPERSDLDPAACELILQWVQAGYPTLIASCQLTAAGRGTQSCPSICFFPSDAGNSPTTLEAIHARLAEIRRGAPVLATHAA